MSWINKQLRRTVVIHTTSKESMRGVLVGSYRDCVVLAHAYYLNADSAPTEIDGEAIVPRAQVAWIQRLEATGGDQL